MLAKTSNAIPSFFILPPMPVERDTGPRTQDVRVEQSLLFLSTFNKSLYLLREYRLIYRSALHSLHSELESVIFAHV